MQDLVPFALQHWPLVLAFIVVAGLLIGLEMRSKLMGIRALSPQESTIMMNQQQAQLLDIRSPLEFAKGHIAGSINIEKKMLSEKINTLDKSKPLILVCAQGISAKEAALNIKKEQFSTIGVLSGGLNAWQTAGLPLVK